MIRTHRLSYRRRRERTTRPIISRANGITNADSEATS